MNTLHSIFRRMLLVWLVLVAALGVTVSRSTQSSYFGNTMAFLFASGDRGPAGVAVTRQIPPPAQTAKEEPQEPEPPKETPPAPEPKPPEWTAIAHGKTGGSGTLGAPKIEKLSDGAVAVVLPLTGKIGNVTYYKPHNANAMTVDFHGEWKNPPFVNRREKTVPLSRVQIAGHKGYLRVTGVAAENVKKLDARAEYSAGRNAVRVVFTPAQQGEAAKTAKGK